jgi:hypothetical protein
MKVNFELTEERLGDLLKPFEIIPPARAGQLVLEVAPQGLNQGELRRVGR